MKIRFNSRQINFPMIRTALTGLLVLMLATTGWCDPVDQARARIVARNTLRHHLSLYGQWNGSTNPAIAGAEAVTYQGGKVAYNFTVNPSGHVLVAVDDLFTPVLLYSTRSAFDPGRADDPRAIESWIVPEVNHQVQRLNRDRENPAVRSLSPGRPRIARAWDYFTSETDAADPTRSASADTSTAGVTRSIVQDHLLTTTWDQGDLDAPYDILYNAMTPDDNCPSGHTLTGCVATAWAQVLKYWEWPVTGNGSHSYLWNGQTLTANFGETRYDWDNMPDVLTPGSVHQIDAVALLMLHTGIAAESDYGCYDTGSELYADSVLDIYFRYKRMRRYYRSSDDNGAPYTADAWFNLIKAELDAATPRPVIFSIFTADGSGGHEVVIDGYQTPPDNTTDMVHINFGWEGNYDGFYAIANDINAEYLWDANTQYIVTGIEPNYDAPPTATIVSPSDDLVVDEGTVLTLEGQADGTVYDVVGYLWEQSGAQSSTITDADQATASFTTPNVNADTTIVFRFRAVDAEGGVGFDEATITVRDTGTATLPPSSGGGGGGGGGCFIGLLRPW